MKQKQVRRARSTYRLLMAAILFAMGGCATMSEGQFQNIRVETQQADGRAVEGVVCQLSNKQGQWQVQSPGEVRVQRSAGALAVHCGSPQWQMQDEQQAQESSSDLSGSMAKGAGVGAGVGMLLGVLAPISLPIIGPAVAFSVAAGGAAGAIYGGAGGAAVDAVSGAAFDYAPRITVIVKPRVADKTAASAERPAQTASNSTL